MKHRTAKTPLEKADRWRKSVIQALENYESLIGKPCPCQRESIEAEYQRLVAGVMLELLRK